MLVDFWTYSCINCRRSLPHVEAWYNDYNSDGFVVVGVSTPEFAFEHVVSNVASAAKNLGVDYPIAVDDNYATWNAYNNQYWPAEYLIDQQGVIRHEEFGEGDYSGTETAIRALLEAGGATHLPPATDVPNRTPTGTSEPRDIRGLHEPAGLRRVLHRRPCPRDQRVHQLPTALTGSAGDARVRRHVDSQLRRGDRGQRGPVEARFRRQRTCISCSGAPGRSRCRSTADI